MTLRTSKMERKYQRLRNKDYCPFCAQEMLVADYGDWIIIGNKFPYNKVFSVSHMLAPKEHISDLNQEQKEMLENILRGLNGYDMYAWNVPKKQTIPRHFHIHLLKFYE